MGTDYKTRQLVQRARDALRAGKRIRIEVGTGADDPVAILRLDDGIVMFTAIGGWSAGVTEPMCAIDSDYLRVSLAGYASVKVLSDEAAAALAGWEA